MYYTWLLLKNTLTGNGGEFRKMLATLQRSKPVIIDVRKPGDFEKEHLEGALNITLEELNPLIPDLIRIRKPVVVISQKGIRSEMVAVFLKEAGVDVYDGGSWNSLKKLVNQYDYSNI
jgi:rhodanese-related sulfurtransferase